jgi:deazaflavin-dependent oxidoreductase (nitroreductase family)
VQDFNRKIIDEFRANEGRVGGPFEGAPMLLLTHTGAKSGEQRTNPLVYLADGERFIIFASKGGYPTNPDWFHNLKANPNATIEVGTETIDVRATQLHGEERDRLWAANARERPMFSEYEERTTRVIPVIALERR